MRYIQEYFSKDVHAVFDGYTTVTVALKSQEH